jgi:hypothetical protein
MVSWSVLDWIEIYGDELLVNYDSGLKFGGLLDRSSTRDARSEIQMGWMSASGCYR